MTFVYLQRGSDKTQAKINDTMPHTCNMLGVDKRYTHTIHIQEIGVVRLSFCFLKLSDFFVRTAKTLSICPSVWQNAKSTPQN